MSNQPLTWTKGSDDGVIKAYTLPIANDRILLASQSTQPTKGKTYVFEVHQNGTRDGNSPRAEYSPDIDSVSLRPFNEQGLGAILEQEKTVRSSQNLDTELQIGLEVLFAKLQKSGFAEATPIRERTSRPAL